MGEQPLNDVKILDLTQHIAGPYCTKFLADFGAEVIKVEMPGTGDMARRMGPFPDDVPHLEKSGLFLHLNSNKLGITLNLKMATGQKILKELVEQTDILVEGFSPGVMDSWGLSYEELSRINPNLIMTSISNFGQTGPYRDYKLTEIVLFALGGHMNRTGMPGREPGMLSRHLHLHQAGHLAAMATLFAFYGREHQGIGGEQIDLSIHRAIMGNINYRMGSLITYSYTGERGIRIQGMGAGYPLGYYPCLDGWIFIQGGLPSWNEIVDMLGVPELRNDPRFCTVEGQTNPDNKDLFESTYWYPWLMERTKQQVLEAIQNAGIASAALNTIEDVVNSEQLAVRDFLVDVEHPAVGKVRHLGAHFKNKDNWWQMRHPAPLLGQHNEEIFCGRLGYSKDDLTVMKYSGVI